LFSGINVEGEGSYKPPTEIVITDVPSTVKASDIRQKIEAAIIAGSAELKKSKSTDRTVTTPSITVEDDGQTIHLPTNFFMDESNYPMKILSRLGFSNGYRFAFYDDANFKYETTPAKDIEQGW